jgi:lipid-A-disaccharide synthase
LADNIFISAGEASGEMYGAQLIEAARSLHPFQFFGLGGPKMQAAGCDIVVESHDVAVVGLTEVVRHLPRIYGRYRALLREINVRKPKAAVLIDFPDFNFRLAKQLHRRGIPVVYFVSPQLWAWRQSRLELVKKYVTKMLVIFPFEEQWYRERGVQAEYVGHPLASATSQINLEDADSRSAYAKKWGLDASRQWIALLPGSRRGEIARHGHHMFWAADFLRDEFEFVLPVAKGLDSQFVESALSEAQCAGYVVRREDAELQGTYRANNELVDAWPPPKITFVDDAGAALRHSRAAVVASGTATVEAALAGTPFVVVYRLSGLTWKLGRRMVKLQHFAMPNLIARRKVVPELIQDDFTAENVVLELRKIIPDGPGRERMLAGLAEVRAKLKPSEIPPAQRAARVLLELIR